MISAQAFCRLQDCENFVLFQGSWVEIKKHVETSAAVFISSLISEQKRTIFVFFLFVLFV